jgi:hypothetical protein
MQIFVSLSSISRLVGALCVFSLLIAGSAWAGDGGANLASMQIFLNGFCTKFGVTCPQLPTATQAALELAAQFNTPTEMVRFQDHAAPAVVAANPPPLQGQPIDLSTLTPLAFIALNGQPATPTQVNNSAANALVYAVTSIGPFGEPDTLHVIYEDLLQTTDKVSQSATQPVAQISLPLTVLSGYGTSKLTERAVQTTLQLFATCTGGFETCVTSVLATGNFSGKGTNTYGANEIGLTVTSLYGSALRLHNGHAMFQVDVPLIVTAATDPLYFLLAHDLAYGSVNLNKNVNPYLFTAFNSDETGFPPNSNIAGPKAFIGFAPFAAPLCPNGTDCSANPPEPGTFGFCASLPDGTPALNLLPAVAAFAAVANSGQAIVSAPIAPARLQNGSPSIVCPNGF